MNRFQRRLTLIVIVLCTYFSAAHESAGQSSDAHGILHRAGGFHGAHVDRQGSRFLQEAGTRR